MARRITNKKAGSAGRSSKKAATARQSASGRYVRPGRPTRRARLRPASRSIADVLDERGPLTGPITDAGTRALEEVRGDRKGG